MWKLPATLEDGERLGKDAFVGALEDETTEYAANLGLGLGLANPNPNLNPHPNP